MAEFSKEELSEFLVESGESLDRLDEELLALETDPEASESISSIFRTVHTIKGTCGFLGFARLESVAHEGENLLARLRDGEISMNRSIADALLELEDALRSMLSAITATGSDGDDDFPDLRSRLADLAAAKAEAKSSGPSKLPPNAFVFSAAADGDAAAKDGDAADGGGETVPSGGAIPDARDAKGGQKDPSGPRPVAIDTLVRVDVSLLDRLMNLVGELVLARNQVLQLASIKEDSQLSATTQRLSLITSELQENVMKTRMQPIGNLLGKFPRIVRDLANTCGKRVRLEIEGRDTELDRTIVEAIRDPLTHLIRNAVDHGVEMPAARAAAGKPEEGWIRILAYHEGGFVNIEVADDGAGIDPKAIAAKALSLGLISSEDLASLTEREVLELLFVPGFSTAASVTSVSGRGVGMDVVKTNVEQIRGSIEIISVKGQGTTFKLRIPLTLAIIPALVVEAGQERFAIPQVSLLELVRLESSGMAESINFVDSTPVMRRRDQLLPLLDLGSLLGIGESWYERQLDAINVVILRTESGAFGVVVDRVIDTQEIVVKPLGSQVSQLQQYSGATIMGDGCVALILDVNGIARYGGVGAAAAEQPILRESAEEFEGEAVLVVRAGTEERVALPLREIDRLETFPVNSIEMAEGEPVVQYRGSIMRLFWLSQLVGATGVDPDSDEIQVVVPSSDLPTCGIVIEEILDITHTSSLDERIAVIGGKVTRIELLAHLVGEPVGGR